MKNGEDDGVWIIVVMGLFFIILSLYFNEYEALLLKIVFVFILLNCVYLFIKLFMPRLNILG